MVLDSASLANWRPVVSGCAAKVTFSLSNFSFAALMVSSEGIEKGLLNTSMSSNSKAAAMARRVSRLAGIACSTR